MCANCRSRVCRNKAGFTVVVSVVRVHRCSSRDYVLSMITIVNVMLVFQRRSMSWLSCDSVWFPDLLTAAMKWSSCVRKSRKVTCNITVHFFELSNFSAYQILTQVSPANNKVFLHYSCSLSIVLIAVVIIIMKIVHKIPVQKYVYKNNLKRQKANVFLRCDWTVYF